MSSDRSDAEMRALKATSTPGIPHPDDEAPALKRQLYNVYRERAELLVWLAALHPGAVIAPAPDVDEPGWQILFLKTSAGGWQLTWHIAPEDADLFAKVEHVSADDSRAQWDGHDTPQKYRRIRTHVSVLLAGLLDERPPTCRRRRCFAPSCGPKCGHLFPGGH